VEGKDFLGTARLLLSNGSAEADFRSAISRAYYACFLTARTAAFRGCDGSVLNESSLTEQDIGHREILRYLARDGAPEDIQDIRETLSSLQRNRIDADYKMQQRILLQDARDAIEDAEALLLSLSPTLTAQIGKEAEAYLTSLIKGRKPRK